MTTASTHIGIIPDGNRRYAREHNLSYTQAYLKSRSRLLSFIDDLYNRRISYSSAKKTLQTDVDRTQLKALGDEIDEISLYLLSEDNLKRPDDELTETYDAFLADYENLYNRFADLNVNIEWHATAPDPLPKRVITRLDELEHDFNGPDGTVHLLFSYSGQADIVQACRTVANRGEQITKEAINNELLVPSPIDYVIRTGDNPRREALSDFLLWQSAYSEYYHIQEHFPAITTEDLYEALDHLLQLRRRKGT